MLKDKIILIALNKPKGFICTHKDEYNRRKAIDLIPKRTLKTINGKIHSVGRLDYNSQGLLLLTNNTKIKKVNHNITYQRAIADEFINLLDK